MTHEEHLNRQQIAEVIRAKRFTDAELAAEYWRMNAVLWEAEARKPWDDGPDDSQEAQQRTLRRFATLPHHDAT